MYAPNNGIHPTRDTNLVMYLQRVGGRVMPGVRRLPYRGRMRIIHSAVTSSVFELVKTVELDIRFNEDAWTARIELLRDTEREGWFRCRVWESEMFRLTPTFPRDAAGGPAHITDDTIMVERGIARSRIASGLNEGFAAPDVDAALAMVLEDLKGHLEHVTGERAR